MLATSADTYIGGLANMRGQKSDSSQKGDSVDGLFSIFKRMQIEEKLC